MQFLVPTRNNQEALAGLLSSILCARFTETAFLEQKDTLVLMDGSNDPVITSPHLARLLPSFDLRYKHFLEPHVNVQRLEGLSMCASDDPVLILDDDLIMLKDPAPAVEHYLQTGEALYGTVVDALNDRRYPDYKRTTQGVSIHSFYSGSGVYPCDIAHAKPGCMLCNHARAFEVLQTLHQSYPSDPAVADDAWAQILAGRKPQIHSSLMFLHIGNKAQWWNQGGIKHAAVASAVKGYTNDK